MLVPKVLKQGKAGIPGRCTPIRNEFTKSILYPDLFSWGLVQVRNANTIRYVTVKNKYNYLIKFFLLTFITKQIDRLNESMSLILVSML